MTRITVRPDTLRTTAARLSQAAREFDALSRQAGAALGSLDWEVQVRDQVQRDAAAALAGLRRLSEQIDQLGRFLVRKADAFDEADQQGVSGLGGVSQSWFQKLREMGQSVYSWFRGLVSHDADLLLALGNLIAPSLPGLPLYAGLRWLRQEFGAYFAADPGTAAGSAQTQIQTQPAVAGAPARSEAELGQRLAALDKQHPGANMAQWTSLIWKVASEKGVPPDLLAAIIMQESHGDPNAGAVKHPNAGLGLMQIEFSAHKSSLEDMTDDQKRAWFLNPENNLAYGAGLLKKELDTRIRDYGEQEGTKRAVQYYNYGPGAADWVEKHSRSNDDWQATVQKASDTKLGKVDHGASYGDSQYNVKVMKYYNELVAGGTQPPPQPPAAVIYDGTTPAAGTTNTNAAWPVNPPLQNDAGARSPSAYDNVINQFGVGSNPRYVPRDIDKNGTRDTFCNIFVWDVSRAMGAEIPFHVSLQDGHSPVAVGTGNYMDANEMTQWLADHGAQYGWHEVTAAEAQVSANAGHPAVAAWDSHSGKPGHVAMVRPGEYSETEGPVIAQAGGNNLNHTRVSKTFANRTPRYFVHE